MRIHLLALALLAGAAVPAAAQTRAETPEKRIERLEQELRAVQRKVFQGGGYVSPEVSPPQAAAQPEGVPATAPIADLTARLDALEGQLRQLTGMAEENSNRLRTMEDSLSRFRDGTSARLDALEHPQPAARAAAEEPPAEAAPTPAPARTKPRRQATASASALPDWVSAQDNRVTAPDSGDAGDAEAAYNDGFHLWEQKRYGEAQKALEAVARKYPNHRYASWAANLAGRAYLDDGKPTTAAKVLLANYQNNPNGERAADSLYFLGQALVALKNLPAACKAYDELQDKYGSGMRIWLKKQLPAARSQAKCR
jgi:TolA-binding protein